MRCRNARAKTNYTNAPDGFWSFYWKGNNYAYSPEEKRLISINKHQNQTIAHGEEIIKFERVRFPTNVPIKGAIGTDVEATVYYRSPLSDRMQSVPITVQSVEGRAARISGEEIGTDRRIEAITQKEREILSRHGTQTRTLGKVARVEFPRGHRFTVDIEGLDDSKARERGEEAIVSELSGAFRNSDDIDVSHEGRIEWETGKD